MRPGAQDAAARRRANPRKLRGIGYWPGVFPAGWAPGAGCGAPDSRQNLAVLVAALGVLGTDTGWPNLIVATVMTSLACKALFWRKE